MSTKGKTTSAVASMASPVTAPSVTPRIRDRNVFSPTFTRYSSVHLRGSSPRPSPHQKPRQRVHHNRHQEQRQANFNQRAPVQFVAGLAEFIRNHRRHRTAVGKQ